MEAGQALWPSPVFPATWETETGGLLLRVHSWQSQWNSNSKNKTKQTNKKQAVPITREIEVGGSEGNDQLGQN
jgi:hypothetical protein